MQTTNSFISIRGFIERIKKKKGMTISVAANKDDNVFNIAEMPLNTITVMAGQKVARVPFHVHAGQSR